MKDERITEMLEALERPDPTDPMLLMYQLDGLKKCLREALIELRDKANDDGGDVGRSLRDAVFSSLKNPTGTELPDHVEMVSCSLHLTGQAPVVDIRLKLVPLLPGGPE